VAAVTAAEPAAAGHTQLRAAAGRTTLVLEAQGPNSWVYCVHTSKRNIVLLLPQTSIPLSPSFHYTHMCARSNKQQAQLSVCRLNNSSTLTCRACFSAAVMLACSAAFCLSSAAACLLLATAAAALASIYAS
jgi:hypothetical protein